jgi:uroporphyrinogen-III synthase
VTATLTGCRVVITRGETENGPLATALRRAGAEPVLIPLVRTVSLPGDGATPLTVSGFDWIAFTSANGVREFWSRLDATQRSAFRAHRAIAVVGPSTAHTVATLGAAPSLIAPEFVAESLANAFGDVHGKRILWPRAAGARSVLAQRLRERGAEVDERILYETVPVAVSTEMLDRIAGADAITFASPSAVRAFAACTDSGALRRSHPRTVCIGPVTTAAAEALGVHIDATASVYTFDGLVAALAGLFAGDAQPVESGASSMSRR